MLRKRWIWLSHPLDASAPGYRGRKDVEIVPATRIDQGASSNSLRLKLSNHAGSHVDAPLHFIEEGKSVESYTPDEWFFKSPWLVDVSCIEPVLLGPERILPHLPNNRKVDMLFIRTGMEAYRSKERYWRNYPALTVGVADALLHQVPSLRAIGLDTISLTSFDHRDEGRRAHIAFLSRELRIFEDLALSAVDNPRALKAIIAMPLRITAGDGAPCTVAACLSS